MPLYEMRCNCGIEKEYSGSYDSAKNLICERCGSRMFIIPSKCGFKVNGYSSENSYSGPDRINSQALPEGYA